MLQATPAWQAAFAQGANVRIVAVIQLTLTGSVEGTNVITMSSGPTPYLGTSVIPPCSISSLEGLSGEVNPTDRSITTAQLSMIVSGNDGTIADLFARGIILKGKTVALYLAELGMLFTDALPLGVFIIDDYRCDGMNSWTLLLKDAGALAETRDLIQYIQAAPLPVSPDSTAGYDKRPQANGGNGEGVTLPSYVSRHPLENVHEWLTRTDPGLGLGIPTSQVGASINPSTWAGSIGHFNTSRFNDMRNSWTVPGGTYTSHDGGLPSQLNIRDAIGEMAKLLGGVLFFDPAADLSAIGQWQFVPFNNAGAVVDAWVGPDPDIDEFEIQSSWIEIYNSLLISYAKSIQSSTVLFSTSTMNAVRQAPTFELQDTASISNLQSLGDASGIHRFTLDTDWLNGVVEISQITSGTGAITIGAFDAPEFGFCGCRYDGKTNPPATPSGWTIPSWAQASGSQPVYVRITGFTFQPIYGSWNWWQEIVRVSSISTTQTLSGGPWTGYFSQDAIGFYRPYYVEMTVASSADRGLFGTTARDWNTNHMAVTIIEDVTIPIYLAQNLLSRANYGQPKLRLTTPAAKLPVQLGDLLSVKEPRGAVIGYQGISPALSWQATRKELTLKPGKANLQWILSLARNPSSPARTDVALNNDWFGTVQP